MIAPNRLDVREGIEGRDKGQRTPRDGTPEPFPRSQEEVLGSVGSPDAMNREPTCPVASGTITDQPRTAPSTAYGNPLPRVTPLRADFPYVSLGGGQGGDPMIRQGVWGDVTGSGDPPPKISD
jgi:hypothetical protein